MLVSLAWVLAAAGTAAAQEPPPSPPPPPVIEKKTEVDPADMTPAERRRRGWDDKRRTLRGYDDNLLYNLAGFFTTGNRRPLLITAGLTAPAMLLDDEWKSYFRDHPHDDWAKIGENLGGTIAVSGLTIGVFSTGRLVSASRFRATTYDLSQAIIITQVYTQALKYTVRRERPDGSERVSFPSGHSSNAFTSATVIGMHYPKLQIPGFAVATYIAVSRMAANRHWFSDIVAGSGIGFGVGRLVVRRNSRPPDDLNTSPTPAPRTSWDVVPDRGPAGDGQGLRLMVSF